MRFIFTSENPALVNHCRRIRRLQGLLAGLCVHYQQVPREVLVQDSAVMQSIMSESVQMALESMA